jgi:hypothetical protein
MDFEDQEEDGWQEESTLYTQQVPYVPSFENLCYNDLKYYLQHGTTLDHLNAKKKRVLRLKSIQYQLIHGISFRKNHDGVLLCCLEKQDTDKVLKDIHDGLVGGPFFGRHHCSQDIERWILLADIIQGCSCLFSKLKNLPKIYWKRTQGCLPASTYCC